MASGPSGLLRIASDKDMTWTEHLDFWKRGWPRGSCEQEGEAWVLGLGLGCMSEQRAVRNSGTWSLDVDPWGEDGRLEWGLGDVGLAAAAG